MSDPNPAQTLTVRMLTVPPGLVFSPISSAGGAGTGRLRWLVQFSGVQRLEFEASDGVATVRSTVTVQVSRGDDQLARSGSLVGDVTGDGVNDIVLLAPLADAPGATDAGAIYVWGGSAATQGPPTATLRVPAPSPSDLLGRAGLSQSVQLADVTGDGVLDVVAGASRADVGAVTDAGAIQVWAGGPTLVGQPAPTATLVVPGAMPSDLLGTSTGVSILFGDVSGDGVLDIAAGASAADVGGVQDAGAVYVWRGGATLSGTVGPLATLRVSGAAARDQLADAASDQGLFLSDVNADGLVDVVALSSLVNSGPVETGAAYVWFGGASLAGTLDPDATLMPPAEAFRLGFASGRGLLFGDVTGDGMPDLVIGCQNTDLGAVNNVGAIYVWRGGPTLTGVLGPFATLRDSIGRPDDQLGRSEAQGVELADVTGDGILDVIGAAPNADLGGGNVYVWHGGGGLVGGVDPTARLEGTISMSALERQRIQFGDLTGDGITDLAIEHAGAPGNVGAIHVWAGGAGLSGTPTARAVLSTPDAQGLGDSFDQGMLLADVTGDGLVDVVASSIFADVGGVSDVGLIHVWSGGSSLTGAAPPTATLQVSGAAQSDVLGGAFYGQALHIADITGDRVLDVVASTVFADVGGVMNTGAVYAWQGGPGLTGTLDPTARLTVPGALANDGLAGMSFQGVLLADVTADGILDVVVGAERADVGGLLDTGEVYVWRGGSSFTGPLPPFARLRVAGALAGDQLGGIRPDTQNLLVADVTGDGRLDLIAGAPLADVGGVVDAGAAYIWPGGAALMGTITPSSTLSVPGAAAGDQMSLP